MNRDEPITQTVILAAGTGTRLADARGDVPKPLMPVAGVPLIRHALDHALSAGCEDAVIVIGHDAARVRAAIEALHHPLALTFVTTPDPALPNGVSLLASEPVTRPRFFLQMVDHLFAEPTLQALVAEPFAAREGGRVLVDGAPVNLDLDDATKVQLVGRRVLAIGKGLEQWDAIDAGCFALTHAVYDALRKAPAGEPRSVSSGMRQLVLDGALTAVDVRGVPWMDVDTPADREAAERLLAAVAASRGETVGA
ncbi:MAG: NTP transferase domain-containing protein [Vicinamibacterales bacterium]